MKTVQHKFVDTIPEELAEGTLYVSIPFKTVVHKCICGCQNEVVTPLSPVGWKITYNGENISLYPSIGNWSFPCKSHYWIEGGEVSYAKKWGSKRIKAGQEKDLKIKREFYSKEDSE